jgi:hypothetical protein
MRHRETGGDISRICDLTPGERDPGTHLESFDICCAGRWKIAGESSETAKSLPERLASNGIVVLSQVLNFRT